MVRFVSGIRLISLVSVNMLVSSSILWMIVDIWFCVFVLMFIELCMIIDVIGRLLIVFVMRLLMFWVFSLWLGCIGWCFGLICLIVLRFSRVLRLVMIVSVIVMCYMFGLMSCVKLGLSFVCLSDVVNVVNDLSLGKVMWWVVFGVIVGVMIFSISVVLMLSMIIVSGVGIECISVKWCSVGVFYVISNVSDVSVMVVVVYVIGSFG